MLKNKVVVLSAALVASSSSAIADGHIQNGYDHQQ